MDFSKIKLKNERSTHVTKRLNRLSSWGFFKVLYRNSMGRMLGTNFLMLFCLVPLALVLFMAVYATAILQSQLPFFSSFGFGTGVWTGVEDYFNNAVKDSSLQTALWCMLAAIPAALMLSGGFAIIRDSFWTGSLKIFKQLAMGVAASIGYAFVSVALIAATVSGLFVFVTAVELVSWLKIVLIVLLSIVAVIFTVFLLILCSVSVTYKQSVGENISDSWRLLWLNPIPNLFNFVIMVLPIGLYFIVGSSLDMIFFMFLFMVGGYYFPFVWQTHMMKTFALFHPVAVNKKGETKQAPAAQQKA